MVIRDEQSPTPQLRNWIIYCPIKKDLIIVKRYERSSDEEASGLIT